MAIVICIGSINADTYLRTDRPVEGPGTLPARDLLRTSGGKAANRAVVARRLGVPARLIGRVGDDDLAVQALAGPDDAGVDTSLVRRVAGPTGVANILVPPDGDKTIALAPNANDRWDDVDGELDQGLARAPSGSVLTLDLEAPEEVIQRAVHIARRQGLTTVLDPAPPERLPLELLEAVDFVTPDHREAEALTGTDASSPQAAKQAGAALRERGVKASCVKLPDGGCVLTTSNGDEHLPAENVDLVDQTGAGDAFAGALASALTHERSESAAARSAVDAATVAVSYYGSQEAYAALQTTGDHLGR